MKGNYQMSSTKRKGVFFLNDGALEVYIAELKRSTLSDLCRHLQGIDDTHRVTVKEVVGAIERYRDTIQ